jgi:hypothetical protein
MNSNGKAPANVKIDGREYRYRFPSLKRVASIAQKLNFDPLMDDPLQKIDWQKLGKDLQLVRSVLNEIFHPVKSHWWERFLFWKKNDLSDKITDVDMMVAVAAFFFLAHSRTIQLEGEAKDLGSLFDQALDFARQEVSRLTPSSSKSQEDSPKQSSGSGTTGQ